MSATSTTTTRSSVSAHEWQDTTVAARATTDTPMTSGQRLLLWVVAAQLALLFAPTLAWLWGRWTLSVWHNAHGLLIPFVVAYFVREELLRVSHLPRSSSALGFLFLVPALALHAVDAGMHTELLAAVALVIALPGLAFLFLGAARGRAVFIPLCFMVFALPIPLTFIEAIILQLRYIATAGTSFVVPYLGIPVYVEETTLHMASGALQVADACSGFSTLYAAMAVAFLTAYSTSSPTRRVLVLLTAAPIAILSNILRVVLLVVLVVWRGPEILETFVHPLSGMMTFALSLPLIFWLGGDPEPAAVSGSEKESHA
jgi:exosortase